MQVRVTLAAAHPLLCVPQRQTATLNGEKGPPRGSLGCQASPPPSTIPSFAAMDDDAGKGRVAHTDDTGASEYGSASKRRAGVRRQQQAGAHAHQVAASHAAAQARKEAAMTEEQRRTKKAEHKRDVRLRKRAIRIAQARVAAAAAEQQPAAEQPAAAEPGPRWPRRVPRLSLCARCVSQAHNACVYDAVLSSTLPRARILSVSDRVCLIMVGGLP